MITMVIKFINHLITEMIFQAAEQLQINPENVTVKMFPQTKGPYIQKETCHGHHPSCWFSDFSEALFRLTPQKIT